MRANLQNWDALRNWASTFRFVHPTGLLPGEWRFPPDRGVPPRRKRWRVGADLASHCSQPVNLGEGATGARRRADREVYLRVRESVARAPDY
jgi:hypothetical protein